ncbi:MAG TPA: hypothetical protein DEQ80_00485 [Anaerolinea thermolimosa]|uniref:Response regulatory domain-containing protein n=1 Tax=Anaerolinea thermolimosa TaxID=229919 RepID=A0A3D1JCK1_9CHLR|nr:hypothetical protein [Anaerolinea thermolimosa]
MTRILVIEDEKRVLENIIELLDAEGFETCGACDGEQGFQKILSEHPDLILCDVRMPRLDGLGLLARISKIQNLAHIPFIFLTALSERADLRAAMELGADDYITKPFGRKELLDAITRRLQKHDGLIQIVKRETVLENAWMASRMPVEIESALTNTLNFLQTIEAQTGEESPIALAVHGLRNSANQLAHAVQNYGLWLRLRFRPRESTPGLEWLSGSERVKLIIEEMAQAAAWQWHRVDDLELNVDEAMVKVSLPVVQRIVEELLIHAFSHTVQGDKVILQGRQNARRNTYALEVTFPEVYSAEEVPIVADGDDGEKMLHYGLSLAVVKELADAFAGQFAILQNMGNLCCRVVFPMQILEE